MSTQEPQGSVACKLRGLIRMCAAAVRGRARYGRNPHLRREGTGFVEARLSKSHFLLPSRWSSGGRRGLQPKSSEHSCVQPGAWTAPRGRAQSAKDVTQTEAVQHLTGRSRISQISSSRCHFCYFPFEPRGLSSLAELEILADRASVPCIRACCQFMTVQDKTGWQIARFGFGVVSQGSGPPGAHHAARCRSLTAGPRKGPKGPLQ